MPPLSAEQLGALTRATRKAHAYLQDRVNADSLDLLRLFRHHRNEYLIRVQRIYDSFLSKEPTLIAAKGTPAWNELMRATQDMGTDLGRDLALTSVENISSMLSSQRRQVAPGLRALFGDRVAFADQPVSVRDVAAEVTTTVSGGGTFMDRITTMTDDLKQQVWSGLRRGLVNGDDFQTVRKRMQKTFGVDKLAEPKYNAYGASKAYEWEARRVWNDVMADIADDLAEDAIPIWWATLDDRTTPGCLARHGYSVDDLGEQPPRHMNCRCEIAVLPSDTDLTEARAEALSWLEEKGFSRRRALSMESVREADLALDTYESASLREANPDQMRDADGKFARTGGTKRAKKTKAKAAPAPAPEPVAPAPSARPKSPLELAADAAGGTETPERGTGKTVFGDSDVKNEIPGWWYNPDSKRFFSVSRDAGPGDHMGLISAGDSKIGKALNLTDDEVKKLHDYYDVSYVQGKMPSDQVSEDVIGAVHSTFKKNVRVLVHKMKTGGTMYAIQTFKLDDALLSKAQEIIGKFSDGKDAAFHPKPTDEVAISNSMDDDHVYTTVSDLLSAKYLKQLRSKRTSEAETFDPAEHPRDEAGRFTRGGGEGSTAEPAPLAEIPPPWRRDLPPSLTALDDTSMPSHGGHFNVGNRIDSQTYHVWNAEILGFAKGRDGETVFAVVAEPPGTGDGTPRYVTLDSVIPHPPPATDDEDKDVDDLNPEPEEWEQLSADQQTEAFDSWYQANFNEFLSDEVNSYRENVLPDDVDENMRDDYDYKRNTLLAILSGNGDDLYVTLGDYDTGPPITDLDALKTALDQMDVSTREELDLSDGEAATLPFPGGPDPAQATIAGVSYDDLVRQHRIATWNGIRHEVARAYEKNWNAEKDHRIDEWEIDTDSLSDNVNEQMRDGWDNMSDDERFRYAREYLEELGGDRPRQSIRNRRRASRSSSYRSPDEPQPRGKEIAVDFSKAKGFAPTHESIAEKTEDLEATNLVERDGEKWKTTTAGERVREELEKHHSTIEELVDAYTPRHPEIDLETSLEVTPSYGGRIDIEGVIRDRDSGDKIGRFTRSLDLSEGEIKHDTFFIEDKYQGGGDGPNYKIGGLFSVATDKYYRALGLKKVKLDAVSYEGDKVTGHQMWPHQGFDWTDKHQSFNIRAAFSRAIERKYGADSTEHRIAEKMRDKKAPAWDYVRFVDSTGEKIGFKLMHLNELRRASDDMPVPDLVAMARPLAEDSAANKVWTRYAEGVTKKFQEKTDAAQMKG